MESAIDRVCEKYGCAKVCLDPKLHVFDDCFPGAIRAGDVDFSVERNGFILWAEWKRGAVLESFDRQFAAQVRQAISFTRNSDRQTFVFILGDPYVTQVERFRVMYKGHWRREWQTADTMGFKTWLRTWAEYAERRGAA